MGDGSIRANSSTILALNKKVDPKKVVSFDNGYLLAKQLVMPQILRRNRNGLNVSVLKKIELVIGVKKNREWKSNYLQGGVRCVSTTSKDGITTRKIRTALVE